MDFIISTARALMAAVCANDSYALHDMQEESTLTAAERLLETCRTRYGKDFAVFLEGRQPHE